jgi:hypothetical protein
MGCALRKRSEIPVRKRSLNTNGTRTIQVCHFLLPVGGLIGGLVDVVVGGLVGSLTSGLVDVLVGGAVGGLVAGLVGCFVSWLIGGLVCGLLAFLVAH